MNKPILKSILTLAAFALSGVGCDVEDYNEAYLDGFESGTTLTDVQKIEYTLTDEDYKTVANNKTNQELAKQAATTEEAEAALAALKAVEKNKCFSAAAPASRYLPAFLQSKYGYYLSDGSVIMATYRSAEGQAAETVKLDAAKTYSLTAEDYALAWGEEVDAPYFTPAKSADAFLPAVLKGAVKDAAEGDFVIAQYAYSASEPSTGGEEESVTKIGSIVAPGEYTVEGTVAAAYQRGFILTDKSGAILVYTNKKPGNYSLGDVIRLKGNASQYNGGWQFGGELETTLLSRTPEYAFPTAAPVSGSDLDAYLKDVSVKYVSMTGTLSISGTFYNVAVEGASKAVGSLSYPNKGQIDASLDGKQVTATGYLFQVSGGKYANMIVTTIAETGAAPAYTPTGVVAAAKPGKYKVKGQVVGLYKRGFLVNDGTGPILYYKGSETKDVKVGDIVTVEGETTAYAALNQFKGEVTYAKVNKEDETYTAPAARVMTAADMEAYLELPAVQYVTYTGTLKKSGNYLNVEIEGTSKVQGSLQYVLDGAVADELDGKKIVVEGWAIGVSSGKYLNTMIASVKAADAAASAAFAARAVTTTRYAVYTYDGSSWSAAAKAAVVNPEDYAQMGAAGNFFNSTYPADTYLPKFLAAKYPYAMPDDVMDVAYYYNEEGSVRADRYTFDGQQWAKASGKVESTDQFVMNNHVWNWDPSVTLIFPPIKTDPTYSFFMLCIDWIKANVENGESYIDPKYGNDEVYAGTSAYYGNIDWRASNAIGQYADGYAGMEDKEIEAALQEHTKILFAGVIPIYYPGLKPIEGIDVTVTLQVAIYTGTSVSAPTHKFVYKVVDVDKVEFVSMEEL